MSGRVLLALRRRESVEGDPVTKTATSNGSVDATTLADPSGGRENHPQHMSVMLETRHLSRRVGHRLLVQDVSIQISAEEVLAVVGPSGAGKSSLLRLL